MVYVLVFFLLLFSCGIKADTQVLPLPETEVRRIGNKVYVLSLKDQIVVENFQKRENIFYTESSNAFCFKVKGVNTRSKKQCVEEALMQTPKFVVRDLGDKILLEASGFDTFALYPYLDGDLDILNRKQIPKEYEISKDYSKKCYALTGVAGNRESLPVTFCIDAKPIPRVEDVDALEYRVVNDRLFLIWSYREDYESFVIYQGDKILGQTKGFLFEVQKPSSEVKFTVRVKTKEGFLSGGRSITYSP